MSKNGKTRHAQAQHAAVAAHCTNHYTRSVMQLESVLEERLAQLSLLVEENSALKRREAALQSAVGSLAGSVSAATKAVLASSATDAADALRAAMRPDSPEVHPAPASCSISNHKGFLLRMQQREAAVQRIMSQLGCVEHEELYSSWLLQRALADPNRVSGHLAMSKTQRVAFVLATVQKLGLLVAKYDLLHHPSTAMGTPCEQVDKLVDDLNERTLAFCLLAPPTRQLEMAYLNMETSLPEPYPRGWWAVVVDAMHLTDDQKAALKICWDKVKPIKVALTAKYELLSSQLAQLQRKQLDQQRQFELQAEYAIDAAISRKAAQKKQQQQLPQQQQLEQLSQQQQQEQWLMEQQAQQQLLLQQQYMLQQQAQLQSQQQPSQMAAIWQQLQQPQPSPQLLQQPQPSPQLLQQQYMLPIGQQQLALQQQQQQQQQQVEQQQQVYRTQMLQAMSQNEHELFQFCRTLLGSELEGFVDCAGPKDNTMLTATATSAPTPPPVSAPAAQQGMVPGLQQDAFAGNLVDMGLHQQPQAQHQSQQQLYASRMAPLQPQSQQQFVQFSPAVAAAAAASDQNLWLHGLKHEFVPSPAGLSPALSPAAAGSGPTSATDPSAPSGEVVADSEDMAVDGGLHLSTHAGRAPRASKSSDSGLFHSTLSSPSSSQSGGTTGAMEGGTAAAAQHKRSSSEVRQELTTGMTGVTAAAGGCRERDLLLQVSDREQRKLERQMDKVTAQLKMQQYCMHTYVLNICNKKQMALKYVNCYPWVPESFSMCEALDEMGW